MNSRDLTKKSRSNFSWAFLCLDRNQRKALYALYAYCRIVDDVVDDAESPAKAEQELNHWRSMLERLDHPSVYDHPVLHELSRAKETFQIPVGDLLWILDGVSMDLEKKRYQTFDELLTYCDGVATAVGLASLSIFGVDRNRYERYAYCTGRALQLTNILRDIGTDAAMGRIYLPMEDLRRFGYSERELALGVCNKNFRELMGFQAKRVWEFYDEAQSLIRPEDQSRLAAAEMMRRTYRLLLKRIEKRGFNVFPRKVKVSKSQKVAVLFSVLFPRWLKAA